MAYYIGVDIGGTNIACGIVNDSCEIIARSKIKTNSSGNSLAYKDVLKVIKSAVIAACKEAGIDVSEARSIGVGSPGVCNSESGVVENCSNLGFDNSPVKADLEEEFKIPVYLDNDANAAAFGEFMSGAAKGAKNAVVITLGTGVGAGIIIDKKIYRGSNFAGGEIGHTVIAVDGAPCGCGRRGCFEAYSSATGLVRMTLMAGEENPQSLINAIIKEDGRCSARTAYKAMKAGDAVGKTVTDDYVKYLACGITNVINTFQPEILCIGGGVCNEGEILLNPLKEAVAKQVYSKNSAKNTEIVICSLGNDAGIIGAAMLHKA
ncbi:MAG: ROK family protein [Oscillospiraceae bacterium]|nr:ROK family protein [Oscillospiraceae bacterium]